MYGPFEEKEFNLLVNFVNSILERPQPKHPDSKEMWLRLLASALNIALAYFLEQHNKTV